jgi:hypothetical protein
MRALHSYATTEEAMVALEMEYAFQAAIAIVDQPTAKKALRGENSVKWKKATFTEYDNFIICREAKDAPAWKVIKRKDMPNGRNTLRTKNICKMKTHAITGAAISKARNVVMGYEQEQYVEYGKSYSSVACDTSIRTCLPVSMFHEKKKDWHVCDSIDVVAAFLNTDLPEAERHYIKLPALWKE